MDSVLLATLLIAALFLGMLICAEVGRRIGIARLARDSDGLAKGVGAAEGALFALLGLLIAFTFSGAASRFEARRHLIVEETNAIGTAYLRLDLLPADAQPELKDLFRRYVDTRMATYQNTANQAATNAKLAETAASQATIWKKALSASEKPEASPRAGMLLLPALNEMIDITSTRVMASRNHPPAVVFLMLGMLSLVGSLLIGYSASANKDRSWLHTLSFAFILSLTVYVIVDLEFPRVGLIRVDSADQAFIELKDSMQ